MKTKIASLAMLLLLLPVAGVRAQDKIRTWDELDRRPIPKWWTDAKFGIFIHWGVYSVPAYAPVKEVKGVYEKYAEHYEARLKSGNKLFTDFHNRTYGKNFKYADFAPMFRAEHFHADDWAKLFRKAGARYVVLTSKHHDGFCLWNSRYSPHWNSVVMGPHMDIMDSISRAVTCQGMHFGFYYSLLEWSHPLYDKKTIDRWVDEHMLPQLQELVVKYKPDVIYADGEWDYDSETLKSRKFLSWLYDESPVRNSVVVNDRWGYETRSKHGDYYTTEYNLVHQKEGIGDKASHPWEESRGMGTSYGYNRFERAEDYLSSKDLIRLLVRTVANGGNLLLDVGPEANGLIPVVMQERLLDMGKWLEVNGEAIYSSRPCRSLTVRNNNVYLTQAHGNLYVIGMECPDGPVVIDGISKAGRASLLGETKGRIAATLRKGRLTVNIPPLSIFHLPSPLAWVVKIEGVY